MHSTARCGIVNGVAMTRAIELRTEIPGPKSKEILERKERVIAEVRQMLRRLSPSFPV